MEACPASECGPWRNVGGFAGTGLHEIMVVVVCVSLNRARRSKRAGYAVVGRATSRSPRLIRSSRRRSSGLSPSEACGVRSPIADGLQAARQPRDPCGSRPSRPQLRSGRVGRSSQAKVCVLLGLRTVPALRTRSLLVGSAILFSRG
jgi:hypothetical protein